MKFFTTLALSLCIAFSATADNKIKIGSLPLKGGCVLVVEEYLSTARLGEKVMIVSDYGDVFAFNSGTVTKVLEIDDEYSVFVKTGNEYYVYNDMKGVAVREGERLQKGDFLGELKYNSRYNEHQLEMQIWRNNGRNTNRLCNDEVVCVLRGVEYTPPAKKVVAKKPAAKKKPIAKKTTAKKKTYASKSKTTAKKKVVAKKTTAKKKPTAKKTTAKKTTAKKKVAKKPVAKKKAPVKKVVAKKKK